MLRRCPQCISDFEAHHTQVYCSQLCRGRAKVARIRADPDMLAKRHASRIAAGQAAYARDPKKYNARSRAAYARDPERHRRAALERYRADPQMTIDRNRQWRADNRDRSRAYWRSYRQANLAKARAWGVANNHRRRSVDGLKVRSSDLESKATFWGSRCWMCGGPFECWDHVKPIAKQGPNILANLRPACGDCNRRKSAKWFGVAELRRLATNPAYD